MKKESTIRDGVIITIITIAAGFLLGGVHSITQPAIVKQQEKTRQEAQKAVFAEADAFEAVDIQDQAGDLQAALDQAGLTKTSIDDISVASDASGEKLGYVVTAKNLEGYGGEVRIMVGVTVAEDGLRVNDIAFLSLSETAGMGMKAKTPEFQGQFHDLKLGEGQLVQYTKKGKSAENEIDAISGSTITTSAVVKSTNAALTAVAMEEGGAK